MSANRSRRPWIRRVLSTLLAMTIIGPNGPFRAEADDSPSSAEAKAEAEADPVAAAVAVAVEGIVTYDGPLPAPVQVFEAATTRPLVEIDTKTKGLQDAVVWLEGVEPDRPDNADEKTQDDPVVMDQENYFFIPHVLTIEESQQVEFLNSDLANHGITASSLAPANQFNVITPADGSYQHRFTTSKHPVAIGCPIHGSMAAWIYVFDHPYHAVTDAKGHFRLPKVPPGQYKLQVRHPSGGMRQEQEINIPAEKSNAKVRIEFHEDDLQVH